MYYFFLYSFFLISFIVVLGRSTLWLLQRLLQFIKYIILKFHHSLLFPLPQFLEYFQQVSFLHLHACVHIFCTLFTLLPSFPCHPYPTGANPPPGQDLLHPTVLWFCSREKIKRKTLHFCLFEYFNFGKIHKISYHLSNVNYTDGTHIWWFDVQFFCFMRK
jgi:hypothetical protein